MKKFFKRLIVVVPTAILGTLQLAIIIFWALPLYVVIGQHSHMWEIPAAFFLDWANSND